MEKETQKTFDKSIKMIFKSSLVVFVGVLLSKILGYLHRIVIARYFGSSEYGTYLLAIAILAWIGLFASFGLPEGVLRYLSIFRGKSELSKARLILKFSAKVLVVTGIIGGVVLYFASDYIAINILDTPTLSIYLKLFSFIVPITLINNILLSSLRAFEKITWYSFLFNIFQSFSRLALLVVFILFGLESKAIVYSYALTAAILLVFAYAAFRYLIAGQLVREEVPKTAAKRVKRELVSYSWPLMLFGAMGSFLYWADSVIIGYLLDASWVGIYNAAVPIAALMAFVPELFIQLFFPLISKYIARNNMELVKEVSKQIGKWIVVANLPVFIILFLFPGTAINVLFGPEYLVAENALRILAVGTLFSSFFIVSQNLLNAAGKSRVVMYNILAVLVFNIALNIILIPRLGINGAAIATASSMLLSSALLLIQTKRYLGLIPFRRNMFGTILISIIPALVIVIARQFVEITLFTLIILGITFVMLYICLLVVFRKLDRSDKLIITAFRKKFLFNK
jgi:O-antigen/teichoic acid export membrane protein